MLVCCKLACCELLQILEEITRKASVRHVPRKELKKGQVAQKGLIRSYFDIKIPILLKVNIRFRLERKGLVCPKIIISYQLYHIENKL